MGPISIRSDLSCRYLYSYTLVRCADSGADPLLGRSQGHPEDVGKCELAVGREPHERTEAHSRKCQTLDASPAEPGELPND